MTQTFSSRVRASALEIAKICGHSAQNGALLSTLFDTIAAEWCERPIGAAAPFTNDLSDDASPFEFSLSSRAGQTDIRLLVEPQQTPYGLHANFAAGLAAQRRLQERHAVDTQLFDHVSALFAPGSAGHPGATFSLWHGVVVKPRGDALIKAYLNPRIHGDTHGGALVARALHRLSFDGALRYLHTHLPAVDGVPYFSIDLVEPSLARAKFYLATRELAVVERLFGSSEPVRRLTAGAPLSTTRPILICAGFRGQDAQPELTLHVPVRCYAATDLDALARLRGLVDEPAHAQFAAAVAALDTRGAGREVVSYVSLKHAEAGAATVYLCPRLYEQRVAEERPMRLARPRFDHMGDVHDLIDARAQRLVEHPFMARVQESADLSEFHTLLQRLGFFTLVFQDVLRLARAACAEPRVAEVCRDLERGDRGHDRWFMRDLQRLSVRLDLDTVFRHDYREARDLTYELLALVTGCGDDYARLSVLLVLEAAAELFFQRVPAFARRCGITEPLEYFGEKHLAAEEAHAIHQDGSGPLAQLRVPEHAASVILLTIEKAFLVMSRLAEDLNQSMRTVQAA